MKSTKIALLTATIALLLSCTLIPEDELIRIVAKDARFVELPLPGATLSAKLPETLQSKLADTKVLLVGETHYVQQHQEYWGAAASALADAGFNVIAQEGMASLSWAAEQYSLGEWPDSLALPDSIKGFDEEFLKRIRAANLARKESGLEAMRFTYFDMNHWKGILLQSINLMESYARAKDDLAAAEAIVATSQALRDVGSESKDPAGYASAVAALAAEPDPLLAEPWRSRVRLAAQFEALSIPLRQNWSDNGREAFIKARIQEMVSAAPGGRLVVNCGMWHAQKRKIMGTTSEWLGTWLAKGSCEGVDGDQVYAIACCPARGERKSTFRSTERSVFDVKQDSPLNEIVRCMDALADGRIGFLNLGDPLFTKQAASVNLGNNLRTVYPPMPFDAILSYPEASVTASTLVFEKP